MVSLLMLKHIRNISDESVIEQWFENIYYQYFSGGKLYCCGAPCKAGELVHFRNLIGTEGVDLILKESIRVNGKDGQGRKEQPIQRYRKKILLIRQIINYTGRLSTNV